MNIWEKLVEVSKSQLRYALVTVIKINGSAPRHAGSRMLVGEDGCTFGTIGGGSLEYRTIAEALVVLNNRKSQLFSFNLRHELGMCCGGTVEVFIEPLAKTPHVFIYGAGHVGQALAKICPILDYNCTLIDEREEWIDHPELPNVVIKKHIDAVHHATQTVFQENHFVVITTHSHKIDEEVVRTVLQKDHIPYIGMIGSKQKAFQFKSRLKSVITDASALDKLHCPIGLQIGAQTPPEIALSILSEIINVAQDTD